MVSEQIPDGFRPIARCRVCEGSALFPVLDLGSQPLANAFVAPTDPPPPHFPLAALGCAGCGTVQLSGTVDPHLMFDNYLYFSSYSSSMVTAMAELARQTAARRDLRKGDLVVEVASNDGYLLRHYEEMGMRTLGVEPAANVAAVAIDEGIDTRVAYFTADYARELRSEGLAPKVIHANNVIAHVPAIHDFVEGLRVLLADDGVVVLETPSLVDLLDQLLFDTIYHEHVFYWSLGALAELFGRHGLVLEECEHVARHGGSLRATWRHRRGPGDEGSGSSPLLAESALRLTSPASYASFAADTARSGEALRTAFTSIRAAGRSLAGYGAAAKATVLLNYAGIGSDVLDFVVDLNPAKQGRVVPGVGVPIVSLEVLKERRPDVLAVFTWNIAAEVRAQLQWYATGGGELLDPLSLRSRR